MRAKDLRKYVVQFFAERIWQLYESWVPENGPDAHGRTLTPDELCKLLNPNGWRLSWKEKTDKGWFASVWSEDEKDFVVRDLSDHYLYMFESVEFDEQWRIAVYVKDGKIAHLTRGE